MLYLSVKAKNGLHAHLGTIIDNFLKYSLNSDILALKHKKIKQKVKSTILAN